MKVNEIEAMALGRVADPHAVRRAPMRVELQQAYEEMVQGIRDADSEVADDWKRYPLRAATAVYPLPPRSDSIRRVERFDLAGPGVLEPTAVPLRPVPFQLIERLGGVPAYCLTPDGMVVSPIPANDSAGGLRVVWLPQAEPLLEDDQVPRVPSQLHGPLAARLLRKLGSLAGVRIADPQAAADWIGSQLRHETMFLNPSGREAVTRFARTNSTFGAARRW